MLRNNYLISPLASFTRQLANAMMGKSITLINSCIDGINLIDGLEESFVTEHIEGIVGKSIAAASQAQFAASLLDNVLGSIGAVTITTRVTKTIIDEEDKCGELTVMTTQPVDARLN